MNWEGMRSAVSFGVGMVTFLWLASTDASTETAFMFGAGAAAATFFIYTTGVSKPGQDK